MKDIFEYIEEISAGARDSVPPVRDVSSRVLVQLRQEERRIRNPLQTVALSYASLAVVALAYHILSQDTLRPLLAAVFREASTVLP